MPPLDAPVHPITAHAYDLGEGRRLLAPAGADGHASASTGHQTARDPHHHHSSTGLASNYKKGLFHMNRNATITTIVGFIAATVSIVAPVAIVSRHSTERLEACVSNGGAYVQVPERTTMECQR